MAQIPYTNVMSLKTYLKITSTDTSNDGFLTMISSQVTAFIENYTGRTFGWGDVGDSVDTDYSNTGNLGITSATISGTLCTFTFYAGAPFVVGAQVIVSGFVPTQINGTWTVSAVSADTTRVTVDLGVGGVTNAATIGRVTADVINYKFQQQEAYDGLVGSTFYLQNMDIRSIDAIWIGSRNIYPPVLLNPQQYVWHNDGRIILGGAYFNSVNSNNYGGGETSSFYGTIASGYQTITVSYHYGVKGVPGDIALAAEDIASAMYRLRSSQGISSEQAGDYRIAYNPMLRTLMKQSPDTLGILDSYRRVNI